MKTALILVFLHLTVCAYSQLNEDFSDGELTSNPVWAGSNGGLDFMISGNILRSASTQASSSFFLTTENNLAMNARWEFWVNLQFSTSGSNYVDVYLVSDKADLKHSSIQGYFVRIGNTDDEISLYKRSGAISTSQKIIDGTNGAVGASNNIVKIRVTRDGNGLFTLEREVVATGSSFYTEGSFADSTITTSTHFGILIQQSTVSFHQKHYFDNFKISPLVADNVPPVLTSVSPIDSNVIEIQFSEAMDSVTVKNISNLMLENYSGTLLRCNTTTNPAVFQIVLSAALPTGNYILKVLNLKDKNGNVIVDPGSLALNYNKPFIPVFHDVLINEIFADPAPQIDLPSVEFVELKNNTDYLLQLKNWKLSDNTTSSVLSNVSIEPRSFIILCAKADTAEYKRYGKTVGLSPWPLLNNGGEKIRLMNENSKVIDSVHYSDAWYRNNIKKQGGWSLERIDPKSPCEGAFNWTASLDSTGGTPGRENSVYIENYHQLTLKIDSIRIVSDSSLRLYFNKHLNSSGLMSQNFILNNPISLKTITTDFEVKNITLTYTEHFRANTEYVLSVSNLRDCAGYLLLDENSIINFKTLSIETPVPLPPDTDTIIISEIFADPSPEIGLPPAEFIELYNPGTNEVNLDKWVISDGSTHGVISHVSIASKGYLILTSNADTLSFKSYGKVSGLSVWPSFGNSGDKVILKSQQKRTVDSLSYSDKWYKSRTKKNGGWSLEKVNLTENVCDGFYNWSASNDTSGGTPGRENTLKREFHGSIDHLIDSLKYDSDSTLKLFLRTIPDTAFLKHNYFSIDNEIGEATSITVNDSYTVISLMFSRRFIPGIIYQLHADSLRTCAGGFYDDPSTPFSIPVIPDIVYPVVINEIFADGSPPVGLPESEFIELFNTSTKPVDLTGMIYADINTHYQFKSGMIPPNSYLILCAEKDTAYFAQFGNVKGLSPWPSLGNEQDILYLKNNKGQNFQKVAYNSSWYRSNNKKAGGYSLELIDPESTCGGGQNWSASIDISGGTPGQRNSIFDQSENNSTLKLLSVHLADSLTAILNFNKSLDSLSAVTTTNFSMDKGIGHPDSVITLSPEMNTLKLIFKTPIQRGYTYQVKADSIFDCRGTIINNQFNRGEFTTTKKILPGNILISEILFNPRPGGSDYLELYNNSEYPLDLKDLTLGAIEKDSLRRKEIAQQQLLLDPKKYIVITTDPDNIRTEYITHSSDTFLKVTSLPSFPDSQGEVILLSENLSIDKLIYSEKMHFQLLKSFEGVSLERTNFSARTDMPGTFRSATKASGYGTPGYHNSQQSETLNSEEQFVLKSRTFSPDNDGFEDLLEIQYQLEQPGMVANITVFNDRGARIKTLLKNSTMNDGGVLVWDGLDEQAALAAPGIYLIYAEFFDNNGTIKRFRKSFALAIKL